MFQQKTKDDYGYDLITIDMILTEYEFDKFSGYNFERTLLKANQTSGFFTIVILEKYFNAPF